MTTLVRLTVEDLSLWITAAANAHPERLAAHIEERTGASRRAAQGALKKLVDAQWLMRTGTSRKLSYSPGALRQVVRSYTLHGLQEDLAWDRDFAPHFAMPPQVARMLQHAFTELLNNAADHSGGSSVTASLRQTPTQAQLLVSDDGCGVFSRICDSFSLADAPHAMLELSKGRLTSQPEAHTGRGLFFSAQLADVFDIHANSESFQRRAWDETGWQKGRALPRQGSSIYLAIALDTKRTLDGVLQDWSLAGDGIAFDRTLVSLRLLAGPLDSRSQARRVAARLPTFKRAEINFAGVDDVGHAFADELFRVFARAHPEVQLQPTHMSRQVAALVSAAQSGS